MDNQAFQILLQFFLESKKQILRIMIFTFSWRIIIEHSSFLEQEFPKHV